MTRRRDGAWTRATRQIDTNWGWQRTPQEATRNRRRAARIVPVRTQQFPRDEVTMVGAILPVPDIWAENTELAQPLFVAETIEPRRPLALR